MMGWDVIAFNSVEQTKENLGLSLWHSEFSPPLKIVASCHTDTVSWSFALNLNLALCVESREAHPYDH